MYVLQSRFISMLMLNLRHQNSILRGFIHNNDKSYNKLLKFLRMLFWSIKMDC